MVNIRVPSPSESKQRKSEVVPNIHQLADLTQNEPILGMKNRKYILVLLYNLLIF